MVPLVKATNNTHKKDYLKRMKMFKSLISNKIMKLQHQLMNLIINLLQLSLNKTIIIKQNIINNLNLRINRVYKYQDSRTKGNKIYNLDKNICRLNKEWRMNLKAIMTKRLFNILVMSTNLQVLIEEKCGMNLMYLILKPKKNKLVIIQGHLLD